MRAGLTGSVGSIVAVTAGVVSAFGFGVRGLRAGFVPSSGVSQVLQSFAVSGCGPQSFGHVGSGNIARVLLIPFKSGINPNTIICPKNAKDTKTWEYQTMRSSPVSDIMLATPFSPYTAAAPIQNNTVANNPVPVNERFEASRVLSYDFNTLYTIVPIKNTIGANNKHTMANEMDSPRGRSATYPRKTHPPARCFFALGPL